MNNKKLYKTSYNKVIAGVCGGLSEYFNMDVTLVRVIWAILICFAGTGFILYIICAIIFPDKADVMRDNNFFNDFNNNK
jgi:phage shock protein C